MSEPLSDSAAIEMQSAELWQPHTLHAVVSPREERKSLEEALAEARQKGYMEGYSSGEADGVEAGRRQAQEMLAQMSALLDAMQKPFADMEQGVHTELLGLVVAITKAVVQRELKTDETLIQQSLEKALNLLGDYEKTIEVEVSPKDADMVADLLDADVIDHRIKSDPAMLPGGCRLRMGSALVDASLEAMIAECVSEITERSRITDAQGNETTPALDPDAIVEVADRLSADADNADAEVEPNGD